MEALLRDGQWKVVQDKRRTVKMVCSYERYVDFGRERQVAIECTHRELDSFWRHFQR